MNKKDYERKFPRDLEAYLRAKYLIGSLDKSFEESINRLMNNYYSNNDALSYKNDVIHQMRMIEKELNKLFEGVRA